MKKIIVFYHKDCWDGFGGAWAAWKKMGSKADYVGLQPGAPPDFEVKNKEVYLIDTAFPIPAMRQLLKNNLKVVLLDHHFSNKEVAEIVPEKLFEMDHSGAVLAWKYFHPKKATPVFLKYVEDADIWKWALPNSKALSMLREGLPFDFRAWSKWVNDYEDKKKLKARMLHGQQLLDYSADLQDKAVKNAQVVEFEGYRCLAVNSPLLHSDIGNKLSKLMPPFGIVWAEKSDVRTFSLRSNGKFDVSKLAQKYGGGGHKAAAGFAMELGGKLPWKYIGPANSD